jgi:TRAP-type C4-dicarboxylate transport system substrate-binding protein
MRRFFLKALIGGAALTVFVHGSSSALAQPTKPIVLKFSHQNPPSSAIHKEPMETFLANVERRSEGRIKTEYYPAEMLVKAKGDLAAVRSGVSDIQVTTTAHNPDATPMAGLFMLPFAYRSGEEAAVAFMKLKDKYIAPEINKLGVKLLGVYIGSPYVMFSADKPIRSLADLRGVKVRTPGAVITRILTKVGAVPVNLSAADIYEGLQKRTVNVATHTMGYLALVGKVHETTSAGYVANVGGLGTFVSLILMNNNSWEALPSDLQKIVAEEGEALGRKISQNYDAQDAAGLQTMKANGVGYITWDASAKADLYKLISEVWDAEGKKWDARGYPASQLLNEFRAQK